MVRNARWLVLVLGVGVSVAPACSSTEPSSPAPPVDEDEGGGGSGAKRSGGGSGGEDETGGTGGSRDTGGGGSQGGSAGASGSAGSAAGTGGTAGSAGTGGSTSQCSLHAAFSTQPECLLCMNAGCSAECALCESDLECVAIQTCAQACTTEECVEACVSAHPSAGYKFQAWRGTEGCMGVRCPQQCPVGPCSESVDCVACCGNRLPAGWSAWSNSAVPCACVGTDWDGCRQVCTQTLCASPALPPDATCQQCVGWLCGIQIQQACASNSDCQAYLECVATCPGRG